MREGLIERGREKEREGEGAIESERKREGEGKRERATESDYWVYCIPRYYWEMVMRPM